MISYTSTPDLQQIEQIEDILLGWRAWKKEDFEQLLKDKKRNITGISFKRGADVIGYAIYEIFPVSINILRFGVCPYHQRQQVGAKLIKWIDVLSNKPEQPKKMQFYVPDDLLDLHLFLKEMGFRVTDILDDDYLFVF